MAYGLQIENPSGTITTICSYIPFLTPAVMSARISLLMPHWSEIVISVLVLILSIFASLWVSAKLFTVGMPHREPACAVDRRDDAAAATARGAGAAADRRLPGGRGRDLCTRDHPRREAVGGAPAGGEPGRGGGARRAAGGRHARAGGGAAADGGAKRARAAAAKRRDARQRDGDLLRQDGHAHPQRDDGSGDRHRLRPLPRDGRGLCAARRVLPA